MNIQVGFGGGPSLHLPGGGLLRHEHSGGFSTVVLTFIFLVENSSVMNFQVGFLPLFLRFFLVEDSSVMNIQVGFLPLFLWWRTLPS